MIDNFSHASSDPDEIQRLRFKLLLRKAQLRVLKFINASPEKVMCAETYFVLAGSELAQALARVHAEQERERELVGINPYWPWSKR